MPYNGAIGSRKILPGKEKCGGRSTGLAQRWSMNAIAASILAGASWGRGQGVPQVSSKRLLDAATTCVSTWKRPRRPGSSPPSGASRRGPLR